MFKKTSVVSLAVLLSVVFCALVVAGEDASQRYRADVYVDFDFDRTIEIEFNPAWKGIHEARVFLGPANISSTPPSPPTGDLVKIERLGENEWSSRRDTGISAATIKRDDQGKLTISYTLRGSFAEGELKPLAQVTRARK